MWMEHLQETEHVLIIHVQDGETALYIAKQKGHMEVVQLLLQIHADVSISKKVYITILCITFIILCTSSYHTPCQHSLHTYILCTSNYMMQAHSQPVREGGYTCPYCKWCAKYTSLVGCEGMLPL